MNASTVSELSAVDETLRLDNQVCFALYSASLAMTRLYKPLLTELGLTYPQYITLLSLWEQDMQTVTGLGQRLFLDSGTLTPLLKRLEAMGLVQRKRSVDDERRVHIALTEQGQQLKSKAAAVPACLLNTVQATVQEMIATSHQLHALRDRILAASP